jgi:hypothetical protein
MALYEHMIDLKVRHLLADTAPGASRRADGAANAPPRAIDPQG